MTAELTIQDETTQTTPQEDTMTATAQTTPIHLPQDTSLEEYTKFRTSVNARFTSTDDAAWQKWAEERRNNPFQEKSAQEWADFVKANKEAHTPAITPEMARAVSNEVELYAGTGTWADPHESGFVTVSRQEAHTVLKVAAEAERDLREISAQKTLNFDNLDEIRALDAMVARISNFVIHVANAL